MLQPPLDQKDGVFLEKKTDVEQKTKLKIRTKTKMIRKGDLKEKRREETNKMRKD